MNKLTSNIPFSFDAFKNMFPAGYELVGVAPSAIFDLKAPREAQEGALCFIDASRSDKQELAEQTNASCVICDRAIKVSDAMKKQRAYFLVENPRETFVKVASALFSSKPSWGIHASAVIDPGAELHANVYVGPLSYIGKCSIDEGTIIYGNCHLYDNCRVGKNVVINAGTIIGAEGFGYCKMSDGELLNFPHVGGVIIEDDVEIGANTCIDRGSLGDTRIKQGAKIDNLCHIAHNVVIGKRAMIIADAMIGGSTSIGEGSWVSPSACLRDQITIGDNTVIGMASVVTKDVPDNQTWTGSPARPLKEFLSLQSKIKKLVEPA